MEDKNKIKRPVYKRVLPMTLSLVILAGIVFGVKEWIFYQHYEATDDAQIDGDISPVVARVGGFVQAIQFKDNQLVHQGDTLVILDDRDFRIQLEKAKANLKAVKSGVDVSSAKVTFIKANVPPVQANLQAAKAHLWEVNKTYERYKNLLQSQAITQSQFDAIKAKQEAANAQVNAAKKQIDAIQKNVQSSQQQVGATISKIAVAQAAVDLAKLQLSYTVIIAPVSGIVSKRNIQIGQLVGRGHQLFAIVNKGSTYVTANFKETQLSDMNIGQPVDIMVDAYPHYKFHGYLASFSGATGAKFSLLPPNNATGNFVKVVQRVPVRIYFDSLSPTWDKKLIPGMSVEATIRIKE